MVRKVGIIGAGAVGTCCAYSILIGNVAEELVLVDIDEKKLIGEVMDLQHGLPALSNPSAKVSSGKDASACLNCDIVIISAGAKQRPGESRLNLLERNVGIFKTFVPQLKQYCPNAILLVISNPVDIMSYVTWKLSGFPPNRVFGSGTVLDTARFRYLLGQQLQVNPSDIGAFIIGEHGDTSLPILSNAWKTGRLQQFAEGQQVDIAAVHKNVVQSAYEIIERKGATCYAIGVVVSDICRSILTNKNSILPVSTYLNNQLGVMGEIYISTPAIVNVNGIRQVVNLELEPEDAKKFLQSAQVLIELAKQLKL